MSQLFHSIKQKTCLLARENKLIVIIHFTLLSRKMLYIDIIESLTQTSKNVTPVITLIMLFTRLWFENPFKLSRWINKYSLTGKKKASEGGKKMSPLLCHKGIGVTFCSVTQRTTSGTPRSCLLKVRTNWEFLKTRREKLVQQEQS